MLIQLKIAGILLHPDESEGADKQNLFSWS